MHQDGAGVNRPEPGRRDTPVRMAELLLTHAYFLAADPHEQELMRPFPPLGLQYLVAWLRREEVCSVEWWDATWQAGPEAFAAVVADVDPRVVGFYGHLVTRDAARRMIAACGDRRIVAGGPDPVQGLDVYFDMGVEVVVIGEGELTLAALVRHLAANGYRWDWSTLASVEGIAFRAPDGAIVRTPPRPLIRPLDRLPWPHRAPSDHAAYFAAWRARHGETAMSLATSRGCPFHCTWCSKQVFGDTFRRRDVESVIDEMAHLRDVWKPDQLWFVDDLFTINRTWVRRFCARVVERRVVVPFYVIARAGSIDAELARELRAAGCWRVYLSAESGAQSVLDAMRKETTVEEQLLAAERLHAAGIEVGTFVMLGYPGETHADVLATRDMLRRMDPEVSLLSVAHPMKGTAFHEAVAARITGERNGRVLFEKTYSDVYYAAAQRLLHAEQGVRRARAAGDVFAAARHAAPWPWWRAQMAVLARR